MPDQILKTYKKFIQEHNFTEDQEQIKLLKVFGDSFKKISKYLKVKHNLFSKVIGIINRKEIPKGIYIHGDVGRGKTFLMKLFFEALKTERKLFIHFHDFMKMLHDNLHDIRKNKKREHEDPIEELSEQITDKYDIICLDELHIMDVTDAMFMARILKFLDDKGTIFITTSNRAPEELYKQDYGKEHFKKFISLLVQKMMIMNLDSDQDYRQIKVKSFEKVVFINEAENFKEAIKNVVENSKLHPKHLKVMGRDLKLKHTWGEILFTSFEELCINNLSQLDYIEIAKYFKLVIIDNIPEMNNEMHNEAKRFIMLIDQLYNQNVIVMLNLSTKIESLYANGKNSFEFQRTISRLNEMQSNEYISKQKIGEFNG